MTSIPTYGDCLPERGKAGCSSYALLSPTGIEGDSLAARRGAGTRSSRCAVVVLRRTRAPVAELRRRQPAKVPRSARFSLCRYPSPEYGDRVAGWSGESRVPDPDLVPVTLGVVERSPTGRLRSSSSSATATTSNGPACGPRSSRVGGSGPAGASLSGRLRATRRSPRFTTARASSRTRPAERLSISSSSTAECGGRRASAATHRGLPTRRHARVRPRARVFTRDSTQRTSPHTCSDQRGSFAEPASPWNGHRVLNRTLASSASARRDSSPALRAALA